MPNWRNQNETETYPIKQALAVANAVFRKYGFVKRNHGYYDAATGVFVLDSKSIVINTLRPEDKRDRNPERPLPVVEVTDEDRESADELYSFFDQKTLMAKMGDDISDFDCMLGDILSKGEVDVNRDMSVLASIPNSLQIEQRRIKMDAMYRANRHVGSFIGKPKERIKMSVQVKDVKWIPKRGVYLVTMMTDDNQIAKFFLKDEDADLSESIRDQRITFVGTVRNQEVSEYTGCHETMFNRIKIFNE